MRDHYMEPMPGRQRGVAYGNANLREDILRGLDDLGVIFSDGPLRDDRVRRQRISKLD